MLTIRHTSFASTPDRPLPLAGYAARREAFDSVDIPLCTSLLLIDDGRSSAALIASIDTLFVSDALRLAIDGLESTRGLKVMLFASHTHNAPSLAPELPLLGACDPSWFSDYVGKFDGAVRRLLEQEAIPAILSFGEQKTRLNVNRRNRRWVLDYAALFSGRRPVMERRVVQCANPGGAIDPRVRVIAFGGASGEVHAVIWTFAAHAAFCPKGNSVSADFPGTIRNAIARRFGGQCTAVYLPGFAGSAVPRLPVARPRSIREALLQLLPGRPSLGRFTTASFQRWTTRLAHVLNRAYDNRVEVAGRDCLRVRQTSIRRIFSNRHSAAGAGDVDLRVAHLALGDSCGILGFSGEMLGEWGTKLAPLLPPDTILSGYMGGPCLYVPTSEELPEGGYEVTGFQPFFSLQGKFRSDITDAVMDQVKGLVHA